MGGLKLIALSLMTVFVVTACAGQPALPGSVSVVALAIPNVKLRKEQYRVNFKARGDNIGMAVVITAMLRAAEITP